MNGVSPRELDLGSRAHRQEPRVQGSKVQRQEQIQQGKRRHRADLEQLIFWRPAWESRITPVYTLLSRKPPFCSFWKT